MNERWPGYSYGSPPPGAECRIGGRGGDALWLEVRWDAIPEDHDGGATWPGWISLGPIPRYLSDAQIGWVGHINWTEIADELFPEGAL